MELKYRSYNFVYRLVKLGL